MGQWTAQQVSGLSELHSLYVWVKNIDLHWLVLPAPLLLGDRHCDNQRLLIFLNIILYELNVYTTEILHNLAQK